MHTYIEPERYMSLEKRDLWNRLKSDVPIFIRVSHLATLNT